MKANIAVFAFCGFFVFFFVCFILIVFHHSEMSQVPKNITGDLATTLNTLTLTSEEVLSLPPCHSFEEKLWLHHTSGECYEVGTQGPCGESMTFYKNPYEPSSTLGFCDCDDIVEMKSAIPQCEVIQRPLIYHLENGRCYPVYSQGPCEKGMWLILNEQRMPECQPNICPIKSSDNFAEDDDYSLTFWFSKLDQCYLTQTKGYCKPGYVLKVVKNNWKPECHKDFGEDCIMTEEVSITSLQCRPGNRLDSLINCA